VPPRPPPFFRKPRAAVLAGLAALIVTGSAIVVFRIAARPDAASIFRDFPDVLLTASVKKLPATDPRTCLVHARQAHTLEPATQMLSGQPLAGHFLEDVRRVQAEIYELLQALVQTHGVREVWSEALGPENEKDINETYRTRRDFWLNGPRDSPKWKLLDEKLSFCAVKRLILEGVIAARGAETFETNQRGVKTFGKVDDDLRHRFGGDEREVLLETHKRR